VNEDGIDYMHLNATELEVLAERGTEFVVN